ncbi:MAG: GDP-fucose synthetase [Opitutia bacterium]|nr:GDP-L-fucose synthase [Opitutales bacterium]PHX69158.1 MAG: GDP-fucose synthetase [Opitutae bacterium]
MDLQEKIYVAGHRGMVGSAIVRALKKAGHTQIIGRTSEELDLRDGTAVREFFAQEKPVYVIMAAARVGGIHYNSNAPYDFIYDNLIMSTNVIEAARQTKVKKLLFLGSSCIYPKLAPQPIKEDSLLTGPLEVTNEAYALAKIAGIKLCTFARQQYGCDFISAMPCNLYGPGDNFSLENSHVLPAIIRKMNEAKLKGDAAVKLWGTGLPLREFLHVDDLAQACLILMDKYSEPGTINLGSGQEVTIQALAEMIAMVVGYHGKLEFDKSKPDGTPRKIMDNSRIQALGWTPKTSLKQGIQEVYQWYLWNESTLRK